MKHRLILIAASLLAIGSAASARTTLGAFDNWAAFRDERPVHCFAIAQPVRSSGGKWRPFASIATWPQSGVHGQLHIRLSREVARGAPVSLIIGSKRFPLIASGADAWGANSGVDAAVVAWMRSQRSFAVEARAATGGLFTDIYVLKGAATAIDAAALGCAKG